MDGQNKPALVALRARREMVVDALSTHFASDALDMDEFEERLDLAHRVIQRVDLLLERGQRDVRPGRLDDAHQRLAFFGLAFLVAAFAVFV